MCEVCVIISGGSLAFLSHVVFLKSKNEFPGDFQSERCHNSVIKTSGSATGRNIYETLQNVLV